MILSIWVSLNIGWNGQINMKISLIPWEIIWLLDFVVVLVALLWWGTVQLRHRKFSVPRSWVLYGGLFLLIAIPLGLALFDFRFDLEPGAVEMTDPEHPVPDLQTRIYPGKTAEQLYQAALRTVQAQTTYLQPWTIVFAEFDSQGQAGRLVMQVPTIFVVDDLAVTVSRNNQFPPDLQVNVYSASREQIIDLGENARHIKQFYLALETELTKPQ